MIRVELVSTCARACPCPPSQNGVANVNMWSIPGGSPCHTKKHSRFWQYGIGGIGQIDADVWLGSVSPAAPE